MYQYIKQEFEELLNIKQEITKIQNTAQPIAVQTTVTNSNNTNNNDKDSNSDYEDEISVEYSHGSGSSFMENSVNDAEVINSAPATPITPSLTLSRASNIQINPNKRKARDNDRNNDTNRLDAQVLSPQLTPVIKSPKLRKSSSFLTRPRSLKSKSKSKHKDKDKDKDINNNDDIKINRSQSKPKKEKTIKSKRKTKLKRARSARSRTSSNILMQSKQERLMNDSLFLAKQMRMERAISNLFHTYVNSQNKHKDSNSNKFNSILRKDKDKYNIETGNIQNINNTNNNSTNNSDNNSSSNDRKPQIPQPMKTNIPVTTSTVVTNDMGTMFASDNSIVIVNNYPQSVIDEDFFNDRENVNNQIASTPTNNTNNTNDTNTNSANNTQTDLQSLVSPKESESGKKVRMVQVEKTFPSNAKPLLLNCFATNEFGETELSSQIVFKKGDDLRND